MRFELWLTLLFLLVLSQTWNIGYNMLGRVSMDNQRAWNIHSGLKIVNLTLSQYTIAITLKGKSGRGLTYISEKRVKIIKHNSENFMKIGWKIRKLWNFEVSQIFTKHFLTSRYEYANEWVGDVITSLLAIYFVHNILKIYFAQTCDSMSLISRLYWS